MEKEVIIYTDGACSGNPGPGGWGAVILVDGDEFPLSGGEKSTTNNRMELFAAIASLGKVTQTPEWKNSLISVYIDSQYVQNGITAWIKNWKSNGWKTAAKKPVKNQDLWIQLDELAQGLNVTWHWVKGHSGNKYNELCDKLAVEATQVATLS